MNRRNQPIGFARFAQFDHSISVMRIANRIHIPTWQGAHIYCLRKFDYEAAEIIRQRNEAK